MDKRLLLLHSAKKLFAKQGVDKTSIREIASDSQVNSSMISYYFSGKDGLIKGIFEEFFPTQELTHTSSDPVKKIEQIIYMIIQLRQEDPELIDILHSEIILKSNRLKDITVYTEPFWQALYDLLETCKVRQLLDIESTDMAYMYIMANISFPYHNPMFNQITKDKNLDIDQLIKYIMKGLR
jgi:AcrR family transcriptional regulator